jgi:hypothetical protein
LHGEISSFQGEVLVAVRLNVCVVRQIGSFACAVSVHAQTAMRAATPERGAILGAVTDTALAPIADAEVEFLGTAVRVTTDATGRFLVTDLPPTTYLVAARRLSFQPTVNVVEVRAGDTLRVAFMLLPAVTTLTPVVIRERAVTVRLREFDERRRQGVGEFFTQQQIEDRNPTSVYDLLRQSKTLRVSSEGGPIKAKSARNTAINCFVQVYLDGIPLSQPSSNPLAPLDLRNLPSPKEIMGIEIYAGAATAPIWLPIGPQTAHIGCGVIMLWTRDGSEPGRKPSD